jgi:hypothetical protein
MASARRTLDLPKRRAGGRTPRLMLAVLIGVAAWDDSSGLGWMVSLARAYSGPAVQTAATR